MRTLPSAGGPAALLLSLFSAAAAAGDFKLAFIDVGQGDAAVVISPSGCAAVLDGGPTGSGAEIKAFLKSQGITHVDFAVVSHYHADHLGGIDEIDVGTDAVTVGAVYDRGGSYSSQTYTAYADHFAGKRKTLTRGQILSLCSEVTFKVEAVNGNGIASSNNENGLSVAVKVTYGSFDALVGGDLPAENPNIEQTLIGQTGEVEVYKVHHHGSKYSSSSDLLAELKPTVSVISVGINNTYSHPTPEALDRLAAVGSIVYQTEDPATDRILGDVVVSSPTGAHYIVAQGGQSQSYASKGAVQDTTAPTAPSELVGSASGPDSVDLFWNPSTDAVGVSGYRVFRSTSGASFSLVGTTTATGFSESGLAAGTRHDYRVTAFDAAGNESAASNTVTVTTGTQAVQVLSPNGGESVSGGSGLEITWTASGVSNVKLEYSLDHGASWTVIASSVSASTGRFLWTVPNVSSSGARVRASDAQAGAPSDTSDASFTIAAASPGKVIINEILANEPGSATSGEFIELVNVGGTTVDIGRWRVLDGTTLRHTFASGTLLAPGKAIVIFGSAAGIPGGTPSAVASSTGDLNLNNTGDTVTLTNASKKRQDQVSYSSSLASTDGVSANRNPDATAGAAFTLHTGLSGSASSPGARPSGVAY